MTAPDLKPCPLCGGDAEIWRAHEGRTAWVACMGRCAVLVSKEYTTDAEAIAAWNARATPAATDPKVTALVEAATSLVSTIGDDPDLMGKEQIVSMLNDTAAAIRSVRAALREGRPA